MSDRRVKADITLSTVAFMMCSSSMLIMNKVAIMVFPAPTILLLLQLLSTVVAIFCLSKFRIVVADELKWTKMRPFILVSVAFLLALYTNIKTLQYANVETFIVFRSSTPVLISGLEFIFLGRQLPSFKSFMALLGMLAGAVTYMTVDSFFEVKAYTWVMLWYLVFCVDQIFIKHVVETVELTPWGRALYTNMLAIPWVVGACHLSRASERHSLMQCSTTTVSVIIGSCVLGVLMSYTSFRLRKLVSATTFTLIGTVCKVLSVFINYIIWDKHATSGGLCALLFCMLSAVFYEQAPMRNEERV